MSARGRTALAELCDLIDRHCIGTQTATPITGLTLYRAQAAVERVQTSYWPALCVMAQGVKQVIVGEHVFEYDPLHYLIATVDLPVTARIVQASETVPLLSLTIDLDPAVIAEVMLDLRGDDVPAGESAALSVSTISDELLDAVTRLTAILDAPDDIDVLAPLVEREIVYRLLRGKHASLIREIVTAGSRLAQIGRVTDWIRTHYAEHVSIDDLAVRADMSVTSFHRHFKAVTGMSPLQFRTQMRLREARRLMLMDARDTTSIALDVGYESPSQFSRDYRRTFGLPPAADAARLRREAHAHAAM